MNLHKNVNVSMCNQDLPITNSTTSTKEPIYYSRSPVHTENPFERINQDMHELKSMLQSILNQKVTVETPDLINLKEACNVLNRSASSIYKLTAKKSIPIVRRAGSKKLLFSRIELMKWLQDPQTQSAMNLADEYLHKNLSLKKYQNK